MPAAVIRFSVAAVTRRICAHRGIGWVIVVCVVTLRIRSSLTHFIHCTHSLTHCLPYALTQITSLRMSVPALPRAHFGSYARSGDEGIALRRTVLSDFLSSLTFMVSAVGVSG